MLQSGSSLNYNLHRAFLMSPGGDSSNVRALAAAKQITSSSCRPMVLESPIEMARAKQSRESIEAEDDWQLSDGCRLSWAVLRGSMWGF